MINACLLSVFPRTIEPDCQKQRLNVIVGRQRHTLHSSLSFWMSTKVSSNRYLWHSALVYRSSYIIVQWRPPCTYVGRTHCHIMYVNICNAIFAVSTFPRDICIRTDSQVKYIFCAVQILVKNKWYRVSRYNGIHVCMVVMIEWWMR